MAEHVVQKFKLIINGEEIPDILEIDGVGLGEDGETTAYEPDEEVTLKTWVRSAGKLTVSFYCKDDKSTFNYFLSWYESRFTDYRTVAVAMFDPSMTNEQYRYIYESCEIGNWMQEAVTRESPEAARISVELTKKRPRIKS